MDLPVEIRLEVYKYTLKRPEPLEVGSGKIKIDAAILYTSKSVCEEARSVLYSENVICLSATSNTNTKNKAWLSNIGFDARQHLRHLQITLSSLADILKDLCTRRSWTPHLVYLPNLHYLDLLFVRHNDAGTRDFLEALSDITRSIEAWSLLKVVGCPTLVIEVESSEEGTIDRRIAQASLATFTAAAQSVATLPYIARMTQMLQQVPPMIQQAPHTMASPATGRILTPTQKILEAPFCHYQGILLNFPSSIQITMRCKISHDERSAIEQYQSGVFKFQQFHRHETPRFHWFNDPGAGQYVTQGESIHAKYMWIKTEVEEVDLTAIQSNKHADFSDIALESFAHLKVDEASEFEWRGYQEINSSMDEGRMNEFL